MPAFDDAWPHGSSGIRGTTVGRVDECVRVGRNDNNMFANIQALFGSTRNKNTLEHCMAALQPTLALRRCRASSASFSATNDVVAVASNKMAKGLDNFIVNTLFCFEKKQ